MDMTDQPYHWPEPTWRGMVERARAGRSLRPKVWPNGATCAVALSFDADHETIPLRDNDPSPMRISQGQYGSRSAMPRIRALLQRAQVPASFFYPAVSALLHPDEVRGVAEEGHEIGIHSWIHELNTKLDYDSSLMADDDAYELTMDGEPTGVVELPPEWIRDDAVYFNFHRFAGLRPYTPPSAVEEIFRAEFEGAMAEGGIFLLTMHPHIIGHRSRLPLLARLIEEMKATGKVWFATHEQVARYCWEKGE